MSSHALAWERTSGSPGSTSLGPPSNCLNWATSGMTNVTSYAHLDGHGAGTTVGTLTGSKYWVLYKPIPQAVGTIGDTTSIFAFDQGQIDDSLVEFFDHEAVVLTPDTYL